MQLRSFLLVLLTLTFTTAEPFDARESTVESVHNALFSGSSSCREVVEAFLARIEIYNPVINAIISLNPHALSIAESLDLQLTSGNATASLFCVPVLLKDNFDTSEMKTTGGSLALADSQPVYDAPTVSAFQSAGAIILGKANMHELALEGLTVSSLGGQTLNPYDLTRTPGGSSGGTGAAIASSFAVLGTGTDTVNSLRSPASANSLFSVRPTRGLISRKGVIPVSFTQDVVGPMARTVKDLAVALSVMGSIGYDVADNATEQIPRGKAGIDYTKFLEEDIGLEGLRFGLIEGFFDRTSSPETDAVNTIMENMVSKLTSAGASVVNITGSLFNAPSLSARLDTQTSEFRSAMDSYLQTTPFASPPPSSLTSMYNSHKFLVIPSQHAYIQSALISSPSNSTYTSKLTQIASLQETLVSIFSKHNLTALIYPQQKNLPVKVGAKSQYGRNGILAALAGWPVVCVPAGYAEKTGEALVGVPVGMEILGRKWDEGRLLGVARVLEKMGEGRRVPGAVNGTVDARSYGAVPEVVPDRRGVHRDYELGRLSE